MNTDRKFTCYNRLNVKQNSKILSVTRKVFYEFGNNTKCFRKMNLNLYVDIDYIIFNLKSYNLNFQYQTY